MGKIFCFIDGSFGPNDVFVHAVAEDGDYLASHASSSVSWAQHDIGIRGDWKHDIYRKKYPDGFELEWVDDPKSHPGVRKAHELNQASNCDV